MLLSHFFPVSFSSGVQNDMKLFDAIKSHLSSKGVLRPHLNEFLLLSSVRHWRIIYNGLVIRSQKVLPVMSRPGDLMQLSDGAIGFVIFLVSSLSLHFPFRSKVFLIMEVSSPFASEPHTILVLQHFLPAPVCFSVCSS
jgi:hypothetical protein